MASLGVFCSYPVVARTEFDWRQPTHSSDVSKQRESAGLDNGGKWRNIAAEYCHLAVFLYFVPLLVSDSSAPPWMHKGRRQ